MRLIFVRHGEPDYEHDCLTPNGREQAAATAKRLAGENIKEIYASPMGRAKETASYTSKKIGVDVKELDYMHEIDWGDARDVASEEKLEYEGHPWTLGCKLMADEPETANGKDWANHPYFKHNTCMDYYSLISENIDIFLAQYGLIRENGYYRCERENNDTIAIFAHGGSGGLMISHIFNLPLPFVLTAMPYGVCSVSVIDFAPQFDDIAIPSIELFNDMGHLDNVRVEKLHFEK
ncbi:MAG: histidine phosphatase family protein [Lachnospiraceae bacterium]|nr:histidine phosphatase family protein [Lachnospiraceae bacterium]